MDKQIVFCYAGELYTVAKEAGTARRLTSGRDIPRFLILGRRRTTRLHLQYDGNTEVYVMPLRAERQSG